jgi:hypothetical protein
MMQFHRHDARISPNTSHRTVPQPPITDATSIQEGGSGNAS